MNVLTFKEKKSHGDKLSLVTCYDYTSARIVADTSVDALLVGDSLAMTMLGAKDTLQAQVSHMVTFTKAVAAGAGDKLIIADMPFLSFRKGLNAGVEAAGLLMQAGAHAVKLEGFIGNLDLVAHLVNSGIPVMGHLGLTPQFVHSLGGYKVQGRDTTSAEAIKHGARALTEAGCFSLVLECVPSSLAREITNEISIPTIGIGAGPDTDGQILVWQDLLGLNKDFKPKFVRQYLNGAEQFKTAIENYAQDVRTKSFPNVNESYE